MTLEEGRFLVKLARRAVETYVKEEVKIEVPQDTPERLLEKSGVFVTLNTVSPGSDKRLRGCIGFPLPHFPLAQAVIESAISAATMDPRFPPVREEELDNIVVEVTVLTPPVLIEVKDPKDYPKKVKVGRDGLVVERGSYKGLLLPQVPVDWNWDEEEFLCECCIKAGLPPDSWYDKKTKIYSFKGIIYEEESPHGEVEERSLTE
ncbi:MAG: TIGR00296 family protein [Candidatus Jordarchaeum sp.]|uniref:TIGR00296 family protein n=1 Tax=Candidatus Jordarchaeum sp. TaxID=2823881 RepID=UPI00404A44B5